MPAPAPLRPLACPPSCSQGARSQFRQGGPAAGSRALWRSYQAPKDRSQGTPSNQGGASRRTERHEQLNISFLHLPLILSSFPLSLCSCRTASTSLFSPLCPSPWSYKSGKGACMLALRHSCLLDASAIPCDMVNMRAQCMRPHLDRMFHQYDGRNQCKGNDKQSMY